LGEQVRFLVIGAGPTGLGAAVRLEQLGCRDFLVLDQAGRPGGLAASHVDDQGFTWDVGGHIQFSHYSYYDDLLDRALDDQWLWHERESWVWIRGRFVPYPFQNNIHRLDPADRDRALAGLEAAAAARDGSPADFRDWILRTFGPGLADLFLLPYNYKVWAYPPERLGVSWMGERVAVPDVGRIRENIRRGRDDVSWGPNNRFRFPKRGGTGAIWSGVARLIDPARLRFGSQVVAVDARRRSVTLASGETIAYESLISSMPLDALCRICRGLSSEVTRAATLLTYSSTHVLGIGLRGERPEILSRKCWMYFPESSSPYYRVTVFSNYSPHNVPEGDEHWSLMAEVSESPEKPVDAAGLREWTLAALAEDRLIAPGCGIASFWHHRALHGYPTPFLGRERVLDRIQPELERHGIYSRGRFGAWKYEVSNQDHSCMQGVEVVDRLLREGDEPTLTDPDRTNSGVFLRPRAPS
jgi:protoporphyrinogen oxidase